MILLATWGDRYISWVKVARLFKRELVREGFKARLLDGECEISAKPEDLVIFMPTDWFAWNYPYSFCRIVGSAGRTMGFVSTDATDLGSVAIMAIRAIHRVLAPHRAAIDVVTKYVPPTRIDLVHLAIDYDAIKEAPDLERFRGRSWADRVLALPRPRIMIIAHHDYKRKNVMEAIRAGIRVLERNPRASLVIKKWEIGSLPSEVQFRDRVAVVSEFLRDEEMYALYKGVDLVVLPSGAGSCELPAIEAIAAGTPTIVSTWFSFLEYVPEAIKIPISRWEELESDPTTQAINTGKIGRIDEDVLANLLINIAEDIEKIKRYYESFARDVGKRWDCKRVVKEELIEVIERLGEPFLP